MESFKFETINTKEAFYRYAAEKVAQLADDSPFGRLVCEVELARLYIQLPDATVTDKVNHLKDVREIAEGLQDQDAYDELSQEIEKLEAAE